MAPFPLDLLEVPDLSGRLALGFAPGRSAGRWKARDLEKDLGSLRQDHGISRLVCLVEDHELESLGIPHLFTRAESEGIRALHVPLPDGGTPKDPEAMEALVASILGWLAEGEGVFLHCWAGLGRTGTVAAACLIARGYNPSEAVDLVRKVRPGAVETHRQENFLRVYAAWRVHHGLDTRRIGSTP